MNKKQTQIIGNTLVEEYAVPLMAEENATLQLLEYADPDCEFRRIRRRLYPSGRTSDAFGRSGNSSLY